MPSCFLTADGTAMGGCLLTVTRTAMPASNQPNRGARGLYQDLGAASPAHSLRLCWACTTGMVVPAAAAGEEHRRDVDGIAAMESGTSGSVRVPATGIEVDPRVPSPRVRS